MAKAALKAAAKSAEAQEPSMEEILASIRQIISEDGEDADDAGADPGATSDDGADADQLEDAAAEIDADDASAMASEDHDMAERVEADLTKAEKAFADDDLSPGDDDDEDSDDEADAAGDAVSGDIGDSEAASAAFDAPAGTDADDFSTEPQNERHSQESTAMAMPAESQHQSPAVTGNDNLLSEDSDQVVHGAFSALAHTILAQNARTLEDLVSEMLQPMLKGWLDDNLPSLVERLVKEEIDRVSRGRR
jgi:cell pole-organizing protein PopZ